MDSTELFARMITAVAACAGLIVAGGGNALLGSTRGWVRALVTAVGGLAATGLAAALVPERVPTFAIVSAVAAVVVLAAGSARMRAAVVAAGRAVRGRPAWAGAALFGLGGVGLALWQYAAADAALTNRAMDQFGGEIARASASEVASGYTDRGAAVPLSAIAEPLSAHELSEQEMISSAVAAHAFKVIRTAPADDASNCHGWVFTGGKYVVGGAQVPHILADNGYAAVTAPRPNDLCVYRDPLGNVAHTAVVLAVMPDNEVLVEGKWGRMGVYMHLVEDSCYGTDFQYFRSDRSGHLLATSRPPHAPPLTGGDMGAAATHGE